MLISNWGLFVNMRVSSSGIRTRLNLSLLGLYYDAIRFPIMIVIRFPSLT